MTPLAPRLARHLRALYPRAAVRRAATASSRRADRIPFGWEWVKRYLPRYATLEPSQLHLDLAADLARAAVERDARLNYIAPRGSAKSTWLSKAYALEGAVSGREPLTLLTAETGPQAKNYLAAIKRQLEGNRRLALDYPDACGRGDVWQAMHVRLRNGCEIRAAGSGGRVLGMTSDERRPTLVVVDDGNSRGDAHSPAQRERKVEWLTNDLLPIGEPGTNFVVAGTPIHREAIVCYLRDAGWPTRSYDALSREPDRQDLWAECQRMMTNLADPDRLATARAFYERNREAMDMGAELLWSRRETLSLFALMTYRALYGEQKYRTEYTSDPGTPEGAEWPADYFDRPGFWFDEWPDDLALKNIALDPSKGSDAKGGDYQAHGLVGVGKDGTLYVDADLRHEPSEAMLRRTVELAKEWGKTGRPVDSIVLEDNGTLGLIRVVMDTVPGTKLLPWETLTNTDRKDLRIRCVGPYLSRGQVRVRNTPGGRMLVQQWREFPFSRFDDAPDAVATALRRAELMLAGRR
jgi:phage terminase large subunit-like protein